MGLGQLLRNIQVTQFDTVTKQTIVDTIVTGTGAYPEMNGRAAEFLGLLSNPAAWRASQLLSDVLGSIPYHAYIEVEDGPSILRTPTPQLLKRPAADTKVTTFSSWALDLIWHGNAIGIIWSRDAFGEPEIVVPVRAEYVSVKYVNEADNVIQFEPGEIAYVIGGRFYKSRDIFHIKGMCRPGELRGMGVLEQHPKILALDLEQRKQAGAATGAGIPTGILKSQNPDLDRKEAREVSAAWHDALAERRVAVLNASTDFQALAWNPTEAQLLEARKFGHVEVALVFGVDAEWLNAQQSSTTYRNVEQSGIELIRRSSLLGHIARFEATLGSHLRSDTMVEANLDSVHRADTLGRYQAHAIGLASKFLAPSEVRAMENRAPFTPEQMQELKDMEPAPPVVAAPPVQGSPDKPDTLPDQKPQDSTPDDKKGATK